MEIKINIPQNNYVQPTEVRPEVVQGICEAFLRQCAWSVFHPSSGGRYREETHYIMRHKDKKEFYGFGDYHKAFSDSVYVKFNGEEMKAAFKVLREAGYFMFRGLNYGTWLGYECLRKPVHPYGWKEVKTFDERID